MKLDATKYWRFTNHGYPKDTEEGEGDAKALALALLSFWQRVTMGSRLSIEIYRDAESRAGRSKSQDNIESTVEAIFAGLDFSKEEA